MMIMVGMIFVMVLVIFLIIVGAVLLVFKGLYGVLKLASNNKVKRSENEVIKLQVVEELERNGVDLFELKKQMQKH